jgi:hypothetical protein
MGIFRQRRSMLAMIIGLALVVGLASAAVAAQTSTDTPASTALSTKDKQGQRPIVRNAPLPPGSIRTNLVSFDIIATGGRTAEVRANTVTFNFVTGWTQVTRPATGIYCLNGAGFNYPAVVTVAARPGSTTPVFGYVEYDSFGANCAGVQVNTYQVT